MKRSLFSHIAALLACALLVNTAPTNAKIFMNQISNQEYKFTVTSPRPGWTLGTWKTSSDNGAYIGFYYETEKRATILSKGVHNSSVQEEYDVATNEYVPDGSVHHEQQETPWGIIDSYYWSSQKDETSMNVRLYAITRGTITYATVCACPNDQLEQFENTFNTYVESLILN